MTEPSSTLLFGTFIVAAVGTFQSVSFPYRAAKASFDEPDAPERNVALAEALAVYADVVKLNPDKEIRLLERPVLEFFL